MVLTLNETSPAGPALASLNGALYLAWAGTRNGKLNIMTSTDAGASFGHLVTSAQTSPAAPGLCAGPDGVFITWAGTGNTKLNVAPVNLDAGVATGIGTPLTLDQTSPAAPALAAASGALYLAWAGTRNGKLNIMTSTDAGASFGHLVTSAQTSPAAPGLCAGPDGVFITWAGTGNTKLNVAPVNLDAGVATGIGKPLTLDQTSPAAPALAAASGALYLAWAGTRNGKLNIMTSTDAGASFGHLVTSAQTSPAAPGLCAGPDGVFITWAGTGNGKLNVAPVDLQAGVATGIGQTAGNTVTVANPGNQVTSIPPLGVPAIVPTLQIQASDSASGQTLTYTAAGLPPGLSLNPATGLIAVTPATAGIFPVTVTATDTTGASGSASFDWTIHSAVTVTSPGNQASVTGAPVRLQIQASDSAGGQTLTYTAAGLPAGLRIDPATGLITGTPATAGTFPVTVTATDTTGASGSAAFGWTIGSNIVTVTSPENQVSSTGAPVRLQIQASDSAGGQTLSYTAAGLPAGLTIDHATGLITGASGKAGVFPVTVTATDTTGASGSARFDWSFDSKGIR